MTGYHRIAIMSGPQDVRCGRARVAGFRSPHDEGVVPDDPDLVCYGTFQGPGVTYGRRR